MRTRFYRMNAAAEPPSPWVCRFSDLIPRQGEVLDLACGMGRHARWLAKQGFRVEAVDKDELALNSLQGWGGIHTVNVDLESGSWPYRHRKFDGIIVSRYLHRPLLPLLVDCLKPQGVLIYETFMTGNERFGKPSNPDFLLKPNELVHVFASTLKIVAFEQGTVEQPRPAAIQRICAIKD